jgi:hypothetical protein
VVETRDLECGSTILKQTHMDHITSPSYNKFQTFIVFIKMAWRAPRSEVGTGPTLSPSPPSTAIFTRVSWGPKKRSNKPKAQVELMCVMMHLVVMMTLHSQL